MFLFLLFHRLFLLLPLFNFLFQFLFLRILSSSSYFPTFSPSLLYSPFILLFPHYSALFDVFSHRSRLLRGPSWSLWRKHRHRSAIGWFHLRDALLFPQLHVQHPLVPIHANTDVSKIRKSRRQHETVMTHFIQMINAQEKTAINSRHSGRLIAKMMSCKKEEVDEV